MLCYKQTSSRNPEQQQAVVKAGKCNVVQFCLYFLLQQELLVEGIHVMLALYWY